MDTSVYDKHAALYLEYIDRELRLKDSYINLLPSTFVNCLGDRIVNARVCDLCCGEGNLGRYLLTRSAREVVGIDASAALIEEAKRRARVSELSYQVDDAQELRLVPDGSFDVVVSEHAMMDVADHRKLFAAVRRVLVPGGPFVFSLLHPCFKGRPYHVKNAPEYIFDEGGKPIAVTVRRYASEGFFNSGGDGIRGRMGSYHRKFSTYINDLIDAGFTLERLEEPLSRADATRAELFAEVPTVLVVAARAI
ncbi:MAG: class I SAM-dependent methyltransferase, partial [Candidatus Binataceae bacterium]